ncbi:MAG TPA: Yip1 family protein [Polyangia bacterium]|nr:Yip1 family protein [Polyangia bacterium]
MSDLIAKVKALLLTPKAELPKKLAEPGELKAVLIPYVAVLAALGPITAFISSGLIGIYHSGTTIFGMNIPGGFIRTPIRSLFTSILSYAVSIAAWWFYGFLLATLAPSFGGRKDMGGALKVAAYSMTPMWVVGALGLFNTIPLLALLLFWLPAIGAMVYAVMIAIWAVPLLLGTPEDKAVGHALAAGGIAAISVLVVYGLVVGLIFSMILATAFH